LAGTEPRTQTPPATPNGAQPSIAQAITEVSERAQILVREEIELAKAEITEKVTKLAKGIVVGMAAGVFVVTALLFALHGLAWLTWYELFPNNQFFWGFLIVAGVLLLLGGLAGFLAARAFKSATPPKPELAIEEAQRIRATVTAQHPGETV
jgi:uncharacterized membrane protein YqjE